MVAASNPAITAEQERMKKKHEPVLGNHSAPATDQDTTAAAADSGLIGDVAKLIANETGLDLGELRDEAKFVELGIDSLMSLVLSEKFKSQLNLDVKGSLFLECSNSGELKDYLDHLVSGPQETYARCHPCLSFLKIDKLENRKRTENP